MKKLLITISTGMMTVFVAPQINIKANLNMIDRDIIYLDASQFSSLTERSFETSKPTFYVNKNFAANAEKNNQYVSSNSEEKSDVVDEIVTLAARYDFYLNDINYVGEIYASSTSSLETIEDKADLIMTQISNGTYFENHNIKNEILRLQDSFSIDSNWQIVDERRIDVDCTNDGEHFGDVAEWRTTLKLNTNGGSPLYYACINETYITPEPSKTDYRTDELICYFEPDLGVDAQLRDYEPKKKNSDATIGYSLTAGANVSSTISTSYRTLQSSPRVYDNGNVSNDYAEIVFDYVNPFDNGGEFYEYNVSQSYQASTFILKTDYSTGDIVTRQDRTISIQRDGFWSNKLARFNLHSEVTIER